MTDVDTTKPNNPIFVIEDAPGTGRGVFALRDIQQEDTIFTADNLSIHILFRKTAARYAPSVSPTTQARSSRSRTSDMVLHFVPKSARIYTLPHPMKRVSRPEPLSRS
jgi:hypothetical protein